MVQHVVFRLHGSLPASIIGRLKHLEDDADERRLALDAHLDQGLGPTWLREDAHARIVADALRHGDGETYRLLAWCVMPNHVHVLVRQKEAGSLSAIVKSWKSFTGRAINRRLGRAGPFWAADYFDRYVRTGEAFDAVVAYIEDNPVKAGLCIRAEDWAWSSASMDRGPPGPHPPPTAGADLEVRAPIREVSHAPHP